MMRYDESLNALVLEGDADTFVFEPQTDLTPAQLAVCLAPLLTGRAELVGALHPLIQRHFRRSDRQPRDAPDTRLVVPTGDDFGMMTWVELVTRALLFGSDNNAILREAERRQAAMEARQP